MRIKFSYFIVLFGFFSLLFSSFHGCTNPSSNNKNNEFSSGEATDKDGGTNNPPEKKKFRACIKGEDINSCQGKEKCKAQRDCDRLAGYDLDGQCYEGLCSAIPEKKDATLKDGKAPDLSCLTNPPALPKGPAKATWWGPVETFGLNADTTGLKVEIFEQDALIKDSNATPVQSLTAATPKKETGCSEKCSDDQVCFKKQCVKVQDETGYAIGYFAFKDLPTNKLFVVKVSGAGFTDTYQFNLWIPANKVKDDLFKNRAFVISDVTKNLIPATAGIQGVTPGHSSIAGEIQDCAGHTIQGATLSFSLRPQKLSYFDGEGSQPDPSQRETNKDGTYVALNIKPPADGKLKVVVAANVKGKFTPLTTYTTKIFPDAITILTMQPWDPRKAKK